MGKACKKRDYVMIMLVALATGPDMHNDLATVIRLFEAAAGCKATQAEIDEVKAQNESDVIKDSVDATHH